MLIVTPHSVTHGVVIPLIAHMKKYSLALLGTLLLGVYAAGSPVPPQSPAGKQTYVARAGNVYISTDEFVKRFEMLPGLFRHPGGRLEEDKLVFLYSLIGEKLLAQEALARKLDTNTAFRASLGEIRTMLARDELYRREISNKVSVSRSEIREGIARARKELIVSYLFFDREEDARQARKRLSRQSDLASAPPRSV